MISEHLLELQALAALLDILCLRAYTHGRCSFTTLGPRACPGTKGSMLPTAAANAKGGPSTARTDASTGTGSPGARTGAGTTPRDSARTDQARASPQQQRRMPPAMSSASRALLASGRHSLGPSGGAGADHQPSPGSESVDWYDHVRRAHLQDCIATVRGLLKRCEEAVAEAADALSPRICCDVPGCAVYFSNAIDLACHLIGHLR